MIIKILREAFIYDASIPIRIIIINIIFVEKSYHKQNLANTKKKEKSGMKEAYVPIYQNPLRKSRGRDNEQEAKRPTPTKPTLKSHPVSFQSLPSFLPRTKDERGTGKIVAGGTAGKAGERERERRIQAGQAALGSSKPISQCSPQKVRPVMPYNIYSSFHYSGLASPPAAR